MDYIFKNGYHPIFNGVKDIHVKDGVINKISDNISQTVPTSKVIDLGGRIVINGFVDGHMHLDKALISERVINQSGTLDEAITLMDEYKSQMTKNDIRDRASRIIQMCFKNGTRFIRTHIDVSDAIKLRAVEALLELKAEFKELVDIQVVAFPQEGIIKNNNSYFYLEEALKLGADLIGGIPAIEEDPVKHIKMIFDLGIKYNVDIDMHIDETDDPRSLTIKDLAQITIANDYMGRVTAAHCCSLSANRKEIISPTLDLVKKADINIIALPSTNLYLQGRGDIINIRRGIAPVKHLLEKEIPVIIGSDNIRDPFNPFGNGKLLEELLIAAHGTHMGGANDLNRLFDMISIIPGKKLHFNYGIKEGNNANFVIIDATTKAEAVIGQANIYGYFLGSIFKTNTDGFAGRI